MCTVIGAYVLLLSVLNLSPMNAALTGLAASLLSDKFGSEVKIGRLSVGLFNRVILNDVTVYDKAHVPLLQAEQMSAKIELRSLLRQPLSLRTVSLIDASIALNKPTEEGEANYQFLIDAFSSAEKKERTPLNLRVNSLILRRVRVKYDEKFRKETPGRLNLAHIDAEKINANISLKEISPDSLRLNIRSLSLREKSGFTLNNLLLKVKANRTGAVIEDFELSLPHSRMTLNEVKAVYDARKQWKDVVSTLEVKGAMTEADFSLDDIRPFVTLPEKLHLGIGINTQFDIRPGMIKLDNLSIRESRGGMVCSADVVMRRDKAVGSMVSFRLKELKMGKETSQSVVSALTADTVLVNTVRRAGNLSLRGWGMYRKKGWSSANLEFACDQGLAVGEADYDGRELRAGFKVTNFNPSYLLANPQLPTLITTAGEASVRFAEKKVERASWNLAVNNLTFHNYPYRSIRTKGDYQPGRIAVKVNSEDHNARMHLDAAVGMGNRQVTAVKVEGTLENVVPKLLNISTPYGNAAFKGKISADLKMQDAVPSGYLGVRDFSMTGGLYGDYRLERLDMRMSAAKNGNGDLYLRSDFLDADLRGALVPSKLVNGVSAMMNRALPGLMKRTAGNVKADDEWKIKASLKDAAVVKAFSGVDLDLNGELNVHGILNTGRGSTSLSVYTDGFRIKDRIFNRTSVFVSGGGDRYRCLAQTSVPVSDNRLSVVAELETVDSTLMTEVTWQTGEREKFSGMFNCQTKFVPGSPSVDFRMKINPTNFILDGETWDISTGKVAFVNRELSFGNVSIGRKNQSLRIEGRVSPHRHDSIMAMLQNIELEKVFDLVNFHAVDFRGKATGNVVFTNTADDPYVRAKVHIPDFTFNQGRMGVSDIAGSWNKKENKIRLVADMKLRENSEDGTKVRGYVSLAEKGLELDIRANNTQLAFLRRYMDGIFADFDGEATGRVKLYGPFKKLDFEGELRANAGARIISTGVAYRISDGTVRLTPGEFAFENFKVDDGRQGSGTANGYLRHTHLKNLNYAFALEARKLLCYDVPKNDDLPFYSTTTGTGTVRLQGRSGYFSADIALRPDAPSTLVYTIGSPEAVSSSNTMIRFRDADSIGNARQTSGLDGGREGVAGGRDAETGAKSSTDIILNFLIDMNPSAQVKIITDARAGNAITAYGEGPIRARFHNKGNFEMYGTYRLVRGTYKLSIQDIIRKDLSLQPGSTIVFGGPPLQADLGLKAVYTVNSASLSDLNYGAGFSNKSVRVDCILNIGGKAQAPKVNFDIDFQNISEDEKQMVRQLIATDEDMNKQVIYLLGIGRFYTTNAQSADAQWSGQQQSAAAMRSLLSTTLSSQLNSVIGSAIGNDSHWSFGTNLASGMYGWSDVEVDGLLQGRLFNDRMLINGNFGYRDNPAYTSNFVGDFDIKYLLTPRGTVSLKAYSETTDRYFTKSSLTTQGIGLILQRDFRNIRDLFRIRKRPLKKENAVK